MRVDLLVLFTSCALLVCASDASNVRGSNPITPSDMSTIVHSVAESQRGIPVKRLLRTNKTINKEERGLETAMKATGILIRSRNVDDAVDRLITETRTKKQPTVLDILGNKAFVKAFKDKPGDLFKALRSKGKFTDKDVALALHQLKESGQFDKKVVEDLIHYHLRNLRDPIVLKPHPEIAFELLMKSPDHNFPFTMDVEAINALEGVIKQKLSGKATELKVLGELFSTLEKGSDKSSAKVISTISSHRTKGARLLEEKLYTYLSSSKQDGVVKRLFDYGKMKNKGVKLLESRELDMLERFYIKSTGFDAEPSVTTKVEALRKGFGNDRQVATLLSKAVNEGDDEIKIAAKALEEEFSRQIQI